MARILLLEDDAVTAQAVAAGLTHRGYEVEAVGDVASACAAIDRLAFDAAILDVMVPGGSGYDVLDAVRARSAGVPVLILTARDGVGDRVEGLDRGGDDYLVKPFAFAELEARLRALDRRGPSDRPTSIVVGKLELDPVAHRATVGSLDLGLTGRQFALLEFFARRVDQVLTRAQILDQVWDWAFDGDPRIIDVYVRALRKALGADPAGPRIETVRGVGYALRPARIAEPRA